VNVLVLNEQQNQLQTIDVDIIKSVTGQFEASEVVQMFKDFFFNKMILDVTALKDYDKPITYKTIADGLNPDKVIFYFKEGSDLCTSGFLSRLIKFGIYNFTTNLDGVKYLIGKSNTYKDVESIVKMAESERQNNDIVYQQSTQQEEKKEEPSNYKGVEMNGQPIVVGFQNVTSNAGATSLIYMLKKELTSVYKDGVVALEIDKSDFLSFGDRTMISTTSTDIKDVINKLNNTKIILIDLNDCIVKDICSTIVYLMEPSTIKLNTLMRKNKAIIGSLKNKQVILNKSLLTQKEVNEFEYESGLKILYNMPPLNDRKRNAAIAELLKKMNLIGEGNSGGGSGKIFGLFRK